MWNLSSSVDGGGIDKVKMNRIFLFWALNGQRQLLNTACTKFWLIVTLIKGATKTLKNFSVKCKNSLYNKLVLEIKKTKWILIYILFCLALLLPSCCVTQLRPDRVNLTCPILRYFVNKVVCICYIHTYQSWVCS